MLHLYLLRNGTQHNTSNHGYCDNYAGYNGHPHNSKYSDNYGGQHSDTNIGNSNKFYSVYVFC